MTIIQIITAPDCENCIMIKKRIRALLDNNKIKAKIVEIDSESEDAVSLAITHGLDNVPSFVVNTIPFNNENFDAKSFVDATRGKPT